MEDKRLERLENKIDKQDQRIDDISMTLVEIKENLKEHMRRSLANEESNDLLQELVNDNKKEVEGRLKSLEKVKDRLHFLGWVLAAALGLLETIKKLGFF